MSANPAINAYCIGCKQSMPMTNPTATTLSNGTPAMTGTCPTCSTKMYKITGGPSKVPGGPLPVAGKTLPGVTPTPYRGAAWPPKSAPFSSKATAKKATRPNSAFAAMNPYRNQGQGIGKS